MSLSYAFNMWLYLFEGSIINVSNMILLWCIFVDSKNRKRREFLIMAAQAFADIAYGIAFMLIAVRRLNLNEQNRTTELTSTRNCAFLPALWLHNIATPLLGLIPMTQSFNFLVCSVFPLWYLQATHKYTALILSVPLSIGALLMFVNAGVMWDKVYKTSIQCIASNGAADKIVYHIMLFFRIAANLGSAVIYAFIIAYLTKNRGGQIRQLSAQQRNMHRNAKITLGIVTANSMIFLFFPDLILFFDPWQITKSYSTLFYSMTLSKTTINIIIYMWRYRELRSIIILKLFGWIPSCEKWARSSVGVVTADNHTRTNGDGTNGPRSNTGAGMSRCSIAPEPPRQFVGANRYVAPSDEENKPVKPPTRKVSNAAVRKEEIMKIVQKAKEQQESRKLPPVIRRKSELVMSAAAEPIQGVTVPWKRSSKEWLEEQMKVKRHVKKMKRLPLRTASAEVAGRETQNHAIASDPPKNGSNSPDELLIGRRSSSSSSSSPLTPLYTTVSARFVSNNYI